MTNRTWSPIKSWMQLTFIVSGNQIENNNKKKFNKPRVTNILHFRDIRGSTVCSRKMSELLILADGKQMCVSGGVNGPHILMGKWQSCHPLHNVKRYLRQQGRKLKFLLFGRSLDRDISGNEKKKGKRILVNASKINLDLCQCFFRCVKSSYVNLKCTSWKKSTKKKKKKK